MAYRHYCDQCGQEIPKPTGYWRLIVYMDKASYSIAEAIREDPDVCNSACAIAWFQAHPEPPSARWGSAEADYAN